MRMQDRNLRNIDYGSESFMDTAAIELNRFSQEEMAFHRFYRMKNGDDQCSAKEVQERTVQFQAVMQQYFGDQTQEPYLVTDQAIGAKRTIHVYKRSRYFPAISCIYYDFQMLYVFSGNCVHVCNGREYELHQGDFCLLEYGAAHKIINYSDQCVLIEFVLKREMLDKSCPSLLQEGGILSNFFKNALYGTSFYPTIVFPTGDDRAVLYYILAIYSEGASNMSYRDLILDGFMNVLFGILLRGFAPQLAQPSTQKNTAISSVVDYIYENYQTVTLHSVAAHFKYSDAHMSKLISSACGVSFKDLLRQAKIQRATWLLRYSDLTVSQIATETNYIDASHFARNFRKEYKMSPGEYRAMFQSK